MGIMCDSVVPVLLLKSILRAVQVSGRPDPPGRAHWVVFTPDTPPLRAISDRDFGPTLNARSLRRRPGLHGRPPSAHI